MGGFLKPEFKGRKFCADIRPSIFRLCPTWGLEKVVISPTRRAQEPFGCEESRNHAYHCSGETRYGELGPVVCTTRLPAPGFGYRARACPTGEEHVLDSDIRIRLCCGWSFGVQKRKERSTSTPGKLHSSCPGPFRARRSAGRSNLSYSGTFSKYGSISKRSWSKRKGFEGWRRSKFLILMKHFYTKAGGGTSEYSAKTQGQRKRKYPLGFFAPCGGISESDRFMCRKICASAKLHHSNTQMKRPLN